MLLQQDSIGAYDAFNDPYRDIRMKAVKQRAMAPSKEKFVPEEGAYNSFTHENNEKAPQDRLRVHGSVEEQVH
jgi:hypothetical protein